MTLEERFHIVAVEELPGLEEEEPEGDAAVEGDDDASETEETEEVE